MFWFLATTLSVDKKRLRKPLESGDSVVGLKSGVVMSPEGGAVVIGDSVGAIVGAAVVISGNGVVT